LGGTTTSSTTNGVTEIDGVNMSTDAAINPAANLAAAKSFHFCCSDFISDRAFIIGGYDTGGSPLASIEKWTHATEAISSVTSTLIRTTAAGASYSSMTHGYAAGGRQSSTPTGQFTLGKFGFANEATTETRNVLAAIQNGANPPVDAASSGMAEQVGSSYHDGGYIFAGGSHAVYIGKIMFDSETEKHMAATLPTVQDNVAVCQSTDKAYLSGGSGPATTIKAYDYINDAAAVLAAVLVGARYGAMGLP